MEKLIIIASVVLCLLAIFVLAYKSVTDKIIKDQEREISALKTENKRLRSALRGAKHVDNLKLSNEPVEPSVTFHIINPEGKKVLERLFDQW